MRYPLSWMTSILLAVFFSVPAFAFAATDPAINAGGPAGTSRNWSGYAATGGTFSMVSGSWTVPTIASSTATAQADAAWIGLGGISSSDLIQVGTQAITQNGNTTYQAWYEILPSTSVSVPMPVNPGDSMSASILPAGTDLWLISIHDNTNGQSYSKTLSYHSSLSSAEWIQEMPSDVAGYIPLDDFGTISFAGAYAVENGSTVTAAQANAYSLTMITAGNQTLATPSSLGADGASFSVTRSTAATTVAPRSVRRDGDGGFRRGGEGGGEDAAHMRRIRVYLTSPSSGVTYTEAFVRVL